MSVLKERLNVTENRPTAVIPILIISVTVSQDIKPLLTIDTDANVSEICLVFHLSSH